MISLAIHPGWVRTENGQNFADAVGVDMPPMSVEQSVEGILKQVCCCSRFAIAGYEVSVSADEM